MGKKADISTVKVGQMIVLRDQGLTERAIAAKLSVSQASVHKCIARHAATGQYSAKKRSKRPRVTTKQTDSMIHRLAKSTPTITAAAIASQLPPDNPPSIRTIQRRLSKDFKLKSYRPACKPLLSAKNKTDRLTFCRQYQHWTKTDWHKVMFSDESTVCQFYNYNTRVRRPVGQRYNIKYTTASVKHPKTVMFWGSMSAKGRGALWLMPAGTTINSKVYLTILQDKLPVWMRLHDCTVFQQDGAPCHTARIVKQWLTSENIILLNPWPGSSPDLNPIEHLWSIVKKKVNALNPTSQEDLIDKLMLVWVQSVTPEYCLSLVESMPSRIRAVLEAKGNVTKY